MERMKLLIGYDGSNCAEAALDDLGRAGLPEKVEAFVLSVSEVMLPPPPPSAYQIVEQARHVHVPSDLKRVYAEGSPAMREAESMSQRAALRLRASFPKWKVTAGAGVGSPVRELISKADAWQPHLIVVGSQGHSALGRLVLGSVSQSVLTYAQSSVRIARGRVEEPNTPVRILIGVDGSPASIAAIREVSSRAWPAMTEVRLIAVNDPLSATFIGKLIPPIQKTVEESNWADLEWLRKVLSTCAAELQRPGLIVSTDIRQGDPKHVLVEVAAELGADCIFVGSVGFGNPFERFVLGSVSAAVAARAHCSVEVVRPRKTEGGLDDEHAFGYSRN
jgi:nucleotide-binding universal stress UspA family protein